MTRKESVKSAAQKYCLTIDIDDGERHRFDYEDIEGAFVEGAEWADKNPVNPWISVKDDLPSNHKELIHSYRYTVPVLVRCNDSRHHIIRMYRLNDKDWGWIDYAKSITHWMSIPKL